MQPFPYTRITEQQIELLQSFRYLTNEKEIKEVRELLNLYFQHKLDVAIEKQEEEKNLSHDVYEVWVASKKS